MPPNTHKGRHFKKRRHKGREYNDDSSKSSSSDDDDSIVSNDVDEHSDDDDDEDSTYAGFAHPHHEPNNNLEDIYTTSIMQDLDDLQQLQFL